MNYNRDNALATVRKYLSPDRVEHSLGVEKYAQKLAYMHLQDVELCSAAGLLHDLARDQNNETMLELAKQYRYPTDNIYEKYPGLLHGPASAQLARQLLGIDNASVLSAIANHTIPSERMSKMDRLIYIADKLEESRSYPGVDALRMLSETDLEECYIAIVKHTIGYLMSNNQIIHPGTIWAYNNYIEDYKRVNIDK